MTMATVQLKPFLLGFAKQDTKPGSHKKRLGQLDPVFVCYLISHRHKRPRTCPGKDVGNI